MYITTIIINTQSQTIQNNNVFVSEGRFIIKLKNLWWSVKMGFGLGTEKKIWDNYYPI